MLEQDQQECIGLDGWVECDDAMPPNMVVVIVEFRGFWPYRGHGGITDLYTYDGEWFNHPENVTIERWMHIPNRKGDPVSRFQMISGVGDDDE